MTHRILAIDDDELVLLSIEELLSTEGFAVTTAPGGKAGLEVAARETFELVLLDLVMPGLSGFEVCKALRAMPAFRDVPIVMLTAKAAAADRAQGLAAGATVFLPKPIHPEKLLETIRAALPPGR
ncbi:MAG: response regulator [Deltaproteobacteria bacterium]|nr:response regulator [Deltaproteobacteria bacterium]